MAKLKSFLAYFWAVLALPLVLVTFMGMQSLSEALVDATGVVVSPWSTGGEVARSVKHDGYKTNIYETVFDGLLWERKEGFVQVVWTPRAALPGTLEESIDYDNDGQDDFTVTLHPASKTAELRPMGVEVLELSGPYEIGNGLGVRVGLKNVNK